MARRRAQRLGLAMTQRGTTYRLADDRGVTHELGPLVLIETHLAGRFVACRPGPRPTATAPPAWVPAIEDYCISLAAVGQRETTIALRRALLTRMALGLGCGPLDEQRNKVAYPAPPRYRQLFTGDSWVKPTHGSGPFGDAVRYD
jgi:hypothetical protein